MRGVRKISTPFKNTISHKSKRTRIRIPQPISTYSTAGSRSALRREELGKVPDWFTVHARGVHRQFLGEDSLEKRAVSRTEVRGTLPERIVYKWLVDVMHFREGYYEYADTDFDFQSSQAGGRMELGGLVADFLFPRLRIIINVQGPTHNDFLRQRKDEEQKDILADMGYECFDLDMDLIYDAMRFEDAMRKIFNLASSNGSAYGLSEYIDSDFEILARRVLTYVIEIDNILGSVTL